MLKTAVLTGCLLFATGLFASGPQITVAHRIDLPVKVDAQLDEAFWQTAPVAADFTQFSPKPGDPSRQRSEVRLVYDDAAIYVGAHLFDTHPDSILQELSDRDELRNTDFFGIIIDAYEDGINGLGFIVTPAGVQYDTKFSALGGLGGLSLVQSGDVSWDAVWDSETRRTSDGWVVEMKIPFAAIRFPNKPEQRWNLNLVRQVRRTREESYWNPVKPELNGLINQSGKLEGIRDIKSPLRLQATPFVVGYLENYHDPSGTPTNSWGRSISGGMDVRYGINDAFTLDMTLIPDFGEARSDNQILNLTPFEIQFSENRQFFTEGVELFNKGNLFYSRRVGGQPLHYWDAYDQLGENDSLLSNPATTQLINATKVSGRTNKGLGLGVFNATSSRSTAEILNLENGEKREYQTSPLTNYNVLVADQNLKNNSYITLLNTNVWRDGADYEANVTGAIFNIRNKANSYAVGGKAVLSQLYHPGQTDLGHTAGLYANKTSGNWQWFLGYFEESDTYNPRDLGFLYNNNERLVEGNINYSQYNPFGPFNSGGGGLWMGYFRLYNPNEFVEWSVNGWGWLVTKSFVNFGASFFTQPFGARDFFEARTEGYHYHIPSNVSFNAWLSTDYRKKLAGDVNLGYGKVDEMGRQRFNIGLSPRLRVSDRFNFSLNSFFEKAYNNVGFATRKDDDTPILGRRDLVTVENWINSTYTFSNRMVLTFRLRHYWSDVSYNAFRELNDEGNLTETDYTGQHDNSFNAFNIDAIYRWRFAPGSDLFIIWKNSILNFTDVPEDIPSNYFQSLDQFAEIPQSNSISVKLIYFLDYASLKG